MKFFREAHLVRLSPNTMSPVTDFKGQHIRSIVMKNFLVWIVLISTAAVGVAVAQPTGDELAAAQVVAQSQVA